MLKTKNSSLFLSLSGGGLASRLFVEENSVYDCLPPFRGRLYQDEQVLHLRVLRRLTHWFTS